MDGEYSWIKYAIIAAVTVGILVLLQRQFRRGKPRAADARGGTIEPSKPLAWFGLLVALAMLVGGAMLLMQENAEDDSRVAIGLILLGAASLVFAAPAATSIHRVNWSEGSIEGPDRMLILTLGFSRAEIPWREIARTGKSWTGYWYVEAADGRRVYWNGYYGGHGALSAALRGKRPDLALPVDMK